MQTITDADPLSGLSSYCAAAAEASATTAAETTIAAVEITALAAADATVFFLSWYFCAAAATALEIAVADADADLYGYLRREETLGYTISYLRVSYPVNEPS